MVEQDPAPSVEPLLWKGFWVVEAAGRRRRGLAAVRIARELGVPRSTVEAPEGRHLTGASLRPKEPDNRYEHKAPGDLLHLDTKNLANFNLIFLIWFSCLLSFPAQGW